MPKAPTHREIEDSSKPEKIPRPPNAWIIYRTDLLNRWKAGRSPNEPPVKQADISRSIAAKWKREHETVKLEYEKRAAIAKAEHKILYPDYKYAPVSKEMKDKIKAEEREAKKRAREAAKAAKAGRKSSGTGHYRRRSTSQPSPSGSNVRLDHLEPAPAPLPTQFLPTPAPRVHPQSQPQHQLMHEPTVVSPRDVDRPDRGCGPSPPIDYNPQSPSSSSTSSSLSRSSTGCSSPLPTTGDTLSSWQPSVPSPLSSPPVQHPPPAYPSSQFQSPIPSRHPSFNPLSVMSTPSESPPSYSEGEAWQAGPPDSTYQSITPLPDFQSQWNSPLQDSTLNQPDVQFPLPLFDPLLSFSGNDQINPVSASANALFDLSAPHTGSANSPPGEFDLDADDYANQMAFMDGQAALRPQGDNLGTLLDFPEFHDTMEDTPPEGSFSQSIAYVPSTLETFATFVNAHPETAMALLDPNYYANLGMQMVQHWPHLVQQFPQLYNSYTPAQAIPQQYMANTVVPSNIAPAVQSLMQPQGQAFESAMFDMFVQPPEIAMPTPTHPVSLPDVSVPPTPAQMESSQSQAATPAIEDAPAPARGRYVPPVGAGMVGRRRVGGRYPMPRKSDPSESD